MFDAQQFIHTIQELDRGAARMEVMANAIEEADREDAHYWRIYFRYEYIKESVFHDDNFKAILMFPTLLRIFDEHPELEDDTYDDIMWAFKLILENVPDYYQISREEIEAYYAEYEKRCQKYGFSLRVYYMKKSQYYLAVDPDAAKEAYQNFRTCKRDASSDCEACEIHYDMTMALEFGDEEEALRIAQPLLDGSKRCGEVPHVSYGVLTKYYLYHGNLHEACYYGKLCERYIGDEPEFLDAAGYLLELYSVVNPSYGWRVFKRHAENFVRSRNPMMRMTFARGAYRLLQRVADKSEYADSALIASLPLEHTEEGFRTADLLAYFGELAEEQSTLLDRRNGTSYYTDLLRMELPEADASAEADAPTDSYAEHGLTERMSAIFMTAAEMMPSLETLNERLNGQAAESLGLLSHFVEKGILLITLRYEGAVYEAALVMTDAEQPLQAKPEYGMERACYEQLLTARNKLMLRLDYNDQPLLSLHVAMKLLHTILPEMLGVVDLLAEKAYPAAWAAFTAAYLNAAAPRDLIGLYICGAEDSDEIWMTTRGMSCLGLRELEIAGANRENFGYYADILHYAACQCAGRCMLPDAGEPFAEIILDGTHLDLTWTNAAKEAAKLEGSLAQKVEREIPSAMLMVYPDAESTDKHAPILLTQLPAVQPDYPYWHAEFIRQLQLAKETYPLFRGAMAEPVERAAVRLEFRMSKEMQQKFGYGRELLWAEHIRIENDSLLADVAQTSEALPEIQEGETVTVTEENITAWRMVYSVGQIDEQSAFLLMQ